MTTDYVKRHGLKPAMRAFSVNDTMINGAPEHFENKARSSVPFGAALHCGCCFGIAPSFG